MFQLRIYIADQPAQLKMSDAQATGCLTLAEQFAVRHGWLPGYAAGTQWVRSRISRSLSQPTHPTL
jgi:hypothetical protein